MYQPDESDDEMSGKRRGQEIKKPSLLASDGTVFFSPVVMMREEKKVFKGSPSNVYVSTRGGLFCRQHDHRRRRRHRHLIPILVVLVASSDGRCLSCSEELCREEKKGHRWCIISPTRPHC